MDAGRHESGFENTARGENDHEAEAFHVPRRKNIGYFAFNICKHI